MTFFLVLAFGLIIGSFLNVCIWRVPRHQSVLNPPRSHCPKCNRQLTAFENIPVISWLALGGRCRGCKDKISGQYPLVEMISGLGAVATYVQYGLTPTAAVVYAIVATLIVISFIDQEFKIIPDVINLPGITIGLLLGIVSEFTRIFAFPITQGVLDSLIGFLCGGGFLWAVTYLFYFATGKVGLGGGDIKLLAFLGAILGWKVVPTTIFGGCLLGSVYGVGTLLVTRGGRYMEIPFGPWLAMGAIIHLFFDVPFLRLNLW